MKQEQSLSERESLSLITQMINKARDSYHDTGVSAMMWGAVVAICALVKLSEIQFNYKLPFDIYLLTLVAIIPQVIITIREKKQRKVKPYDEAYMDYIWLAFGICIFLTIHAINLLANGLQPVLQEQQRLAGSEPPFHLYEYVSSFFLILYGLPTFITGAACKFRPMLWGGLFCWAGSVITIYTPIRIDLLITAAAAILAWFIPGLIMESEYRIYKKEQVQKNV